MTKNLIYNDNTTSSEPLIWDLRDPEGPLLGRLRGVAARHELWGYYGGITNQAKPDNAHFVLRRSAPLEWPDLLSNEQRVLVVSKRLRESIQELYPDLKFWSIGIQDAAGAEVAKEYSLAVLKQASCIDPGESTFIANNSEWVKEYRGMKYRETDLPAHVFWAQGLWLILAKPELVRHLEQKKFSNVRFTKICDYSGHSWELQPYSYETLNAGGQGADLEFDGNAMNELLSDIQKGNSIRGRITSKVVVAMRPPKSRKKLCDIMKASGCLLISERVKTILTEAGAEDIEFFEATILDHDRKTMEARYYLVNVLKTIPYVNIEESSIEWRFGLIWTVYDLVVDESRLTEKPALFRLGPKTRYPWYFMRSDILDKLASMKTTGWMSTATSLLTFSNEVSHL
jgi:hypothetical protein